MSTLKTPTPSEELLSIAHLLHLTHHRNKNQHRLAKWHKEFSQLRRQLGKLVPEMQAFETAVSFSSSSSSSVQGKGEGMGRLQKEESKYVKAAREKVEARVEFLESRIVPRCYVAFSNVISDNQYAVLGLMLMGSLAKTQSMMMEWRKEFGVQDEEPALGGREGGGGEVEEEESKGGVDLGEVVMREEIVEGVVGIREDENGEVVEGKKSKRKKRGESTGKEEVGKVGEREVEQAKRPKKKRKKGGDAFDEMFAGLI